MPAREATTESCVWLLGSRPALYVHEPNRLLKNDVAHCLTVSPPNRGKLTMSPQALHTGHEQGIVAAGFRREQYGRIILWCAWLPGHEVGSDRWRLHILASVALPVGEVCNLKARLGSWRDFAPKWTAEGHGA